jgi:signal transduction histidine kinase
MSVRLTRIGAWLRPGDGEPRVPSSPSPEIVRDTPAWSPSSYFARTACPTAWVRLLLALGNALVIYLDPSLPVSREWSTCALTDFIVLLIIAYSLWAWRKETRWVPAAGSPRLIAWLDVLCSAALIAVTGAHKSPFFMWNVFTIVGSALNNGWRTAVRVCVVQTILYVAICLPNAAHPDFRIAVFLVRTSYLFAIALVLAHMGQRLLEQNRMLAGLHRAAAHMSAGRSTAAILGRVADSLTDMLEVDQVAVCWQDGTDNPCPALVNLDRAHGEQLLRLARGCLAAGSPINAPQTLIANAADRDSRFAAAREALAGARHLLITGLTDSRGEPGLLVVCGRLGARSFLRSDQELAELLSAHAGPLLETARLQEQRRYHAGVDERRRIAGELHDRLIQTLASIDLHALNGGELWQERRWEPLGEELRRLKQLAEEALEEARGVVSELAPVRLREAGLAVYLEDCLRHFQERASTPVEASIDLEEIDVPEPTALLLIGLLREGLNNVRKHALATRVTLRIAPRGEGVSFRLADNGRGFCPEQSPLRQAPTRQYGLAYLRERVAAIGGELRVISRPEAGTVLEARVPLLTEEVLVSRFAQTMG